jgi:hypothetical protein
VLAGVEFTVVTDLWFWPPGVGVVVTVLWRQIWCLLVMVLWCDRFGFTMCLLVFGECDCDRLEMEEMRGVVVGCRFRRSMWS